MRLMTETRQLMQGFNIWRKFEWILALLYLISGCFSISVVGFTRKDFGERYFGFFNLLFGYTVIANFAFLGNFLGVATGHKFSWLMVLFWLGFIAVSLYHRAVIARRNKRGQEWHSMYIGESWLTSLPLPCSREKIFKLVEPGLVFLAGLIFWKISGAVGIWLMISGLSLFVNNHLVFWFERQAFLDVIDARIEARYMSGAVQGKPAKQTGGFVLAESNIQMIRRDPGLQNIFVKLSQDMKDMLNTEPGFGPASA